MCNISYAERWSWASKWSLRGEWHAHDRRSARDGDVHIAAEWNTKDGGSPGHGHNQARPDVLIWERRRARCRSEVDARGRDGGSAAHLCSRGGAERCTACDGDNENHENKRFRVLPFYGGGGFRSSELRCYYPNAGAMIRYTEDLSRSVKEMQICVCALWRSQRNIRRVSTTAARQSSTASVTASASASSLPIPCQCFCLLCSRWRRCRR
jgi:hypothetical protein